MSRLTLKTGLRFLSLIRIWVLALPLGLILTGAGMNQAVVIANHGKFPVMENPRLVDNNNPDKNGMTDELHCLMTPQTHLNWLADVFDLQSDILSPGDLFIQLGEYMWPIAKIVWLTLLLFHIRQGMV